MEKVIKRFTKVLVKRNICTSEEECIYIYGVMLLLTTSLLIMSILFLSIVLFDFWYGVFYLTLFIPLRVCAGGYHCKTYLSCFFISNIIFVVDMFFANWIMSLQPLSSGILSVVLSVVACVYIISNAPVLNSNNPLTINRRSKNRKRAIMLSAAMFVIVVFCTFMLNKLSLSKNFLSIATSVECTIAFLMFIEKIKQKGEKEC